ncbi:MAG: hypothetical protein JXB30_02635 [Anaerolineae bacterium]|nr:hypothetical protein [Anaerolineae bacterium]
MRIVIVVVLVLLAIGMFWATQQGFITNETLQITANVATVVAGIAAVLVFVVPAPKSEQSSEWRVRLWQYLRSLGRWLVKRWQCILAILIVSVVAVLISRLPWFIGPLIDHTVKTTMTAQPTRTMAPTYTLVPTYTPASTWTPVPTYTLYPTPEPTPSPITCADYGIKITSHTNGAAVGGTFQISGTYENEPPGDYLFLINKVPDQSLYWPSSKAVELNRALKKWYGEAYVNGVPPKEEDILVAIVGKSGRTLFEYYLKIGRVMDNWYAIEILTDDILVCDKITVEKTTE